jgi:hypothetical protein
MARPQHRSEPQQPSPQPGLKVVGNGQGKPDGAPDQPGAPAQDALAQQTRTRAAEARRKLHPARVWPD